MAMSINGVQIPTNIANRGKYKFVPQEIVARNGMGEPVLAGYSKLEWTWQYMSFTDFDWWQTTLLTGQRWRRFTAAVLTNDSRVETSFTNCIVNKPTYEHIYANWYENVTVVIEQII